MVGFKPAIPVFVDWIRHGISELQTSTLEIEASRIGQFKQGQGIVATSDIQQALTNYEPAGSTNLHEAIRSAKDYELSIIVTDGVAATSPNTNSKDCAAGVDASCVARALKDVVSAQIGHGSDEDRGVWLIPLWSNYDGLFFTEEGVDATTFDPSTTIQKIRSDLAGEAIIQNPKRGGDGNLVFEYRGPRALLLIVISRWTDIGRSVVQALWNKSELKNVVHLNKLNGLVTGSACFTPIEVYPGYLNQLQWQNLQPSEEPSDSKGALDVAFSNTPNSKIQLTCPTTGENRGVYFLTGKASSADQNSGCVPLQMLPAFQFQLLPKDTNQELALSHFIPGYSVESGYSKLKLTFRCEGENLFPCGQSNATIQWVSLINYQKAADTLASNSNETEVHSVIKSISTIHPSQEPHRILGFSTMLELFYREMSQNKRSIVLGQFELCCETAH